MHMHLTVAHGKPQPGLSEPALGMHRAQRPQPYTYSLELARKGLNVVIMSRSEEKLQKVADEISKSILIAVFGFQINNCSHRLWGKVSLPPLIYGSI